MQQLNFSSMMRSGPTRTFSLVSGSSGNSVFIGRDSTGILVDSGVSAKRLSEALRAHGEDPALLSGIVITHEHHDHICGMSVLARKHGIPVYMPLETWLRIEPVTRFAERIDVRPIRPGSPFAIGDLWVRPFRISHDAVCAVGYRVETGQAVVSVATDMGVVTPEAAAALEGSDLVYLEANYDPLMLANGPYPWHLQERIRSERGHLSNAQSAEAIEGLVRSGATRVILAHLSKENNLPDLAHREIRQRLRARGIRIGEDLALDVAPRYLPSPVTVLGC